MIAQLDFAQALGLYNYWVVIFLMMTGFYMVIARGNLIKTIIGLNIFQTSVVLFYVTMGKVKGGTAPIMPLDAGHDDHGHGPEGATHHTTDYGMHLQQPLTDRVGVAGEGEYSTTLGGEHSIQLAGFEDAVQNHGDAVHQTAEAIYSNPLPSVLMLTAIVVGVATTALALALAVRVREEYGTIEEDEILEMDQAA